MKKSPIYNDFSQSPDREKGAGMDDREYQARACRSPRRSWADLSAARTQAQAKDLGWWQQEVRWLQPASERAPYRPHPVTVLAVGIPVAIGVGLVASRILHSDTGRDVSAV